MHCEHVGQEHTRWIELEMKMNKIGTPIYRLKNGHLKAQLNETNLRRGCIQCLKYQTLKLLTLAIEFANQDRKVDWMQALMKLK